MHVMGLRSDITGCYAGFEKVAAGGSSLHAYLIMISIIFALVTSWRYQLKYKIIGWVAKTVTDKTIFLFFVIN